jgi:hypothetical protein
MRLDPVHRTILTLDVEGSTTGTNATRYEVRNRTYEIVEEAMQQAGISARRHAPFLDRGDGMIALLREVPKTLLLDTVVPRIAELLEGERFRLRAAMHAGEVHKDPRGYFGEAIDLTCRLLNAQQTKRALRNSTATLVLAVSDNIYRSVVCQGYDGIDSATFQPLVRVRLGGRMYRGWLQPAMRSSATNTQLAAQAAYVLPTTNHPRNHHHTTTAENG